ncbi:hypothetical protein ACS0TY_005808 [Phlomoides rotata]
MLTDRGNTYRVADLIQPDIMQWNINRVQSLFEPKDAENILKTPMSSHFVDDRRIWNHTKLGHFTVRSAYFLATNRFSSCGHDIPSASLASSPWKKIWYIGIPPKVKHFICGTYSNALPTLQALKRRGVNMDAICPTCGPESHPSGPSGPPDHGLQDSSVAPHVVAAGSRVTRIYDGILASVEVVESALVSRRGQRGAQSDCRSGRWSLPAQGMLKLNSDAGVFSDGSVGLGFVVRDEKGMVILVGAKWSSIVTDNSTLIEALALRFGAISALNHGLTVALLETDSRNLVRAIQSKIEVDVLLPWLSMI